MNAEQVVKKILSEAHEQAEAIAQDAQQKRQRQTQQLDEELSAYRAETERLANAAAEDRRSRMLAAARMENARAFLAAKADLLDEVFGKAQERVVKLPDEQYRNVMIRLMQKAVETGDEEVIVGKNERRIDDGFIKQVNRSLGAGFKGNLRLSDQRADIRGGFILARGKVRMNAGVEVLVERLREALETELAARLFG
ncbi:MAG: hypothetical protein GXY41_01010 [Phycisphaerae bacterium]|nr:hypothetical protein [Phycisphaerae bacterium]